MKKLLFVMACLTSGITIAQKKYDKFLADNEWKPGSIVLVNGEEASGEVKFNEKTGVLSFRTEDESATFTPNTVTKFAFQQNDTLERVFYSLLIKEEHELRERLAFFEVLRQLKNFAVLARPDRVERKQQQITAPTMMPDGSMMPGYSYEYLDQNETIFFVDDKGNVAPYMMVSNRSDNFKARARIVNGYLLKLYTEPHYDALQAFVKARKLKVKRREDLLVILDHYAQLAGSEVK